VRVSWQAHESWKVNGVAQLPSASHEVEHTVYAQIDHRQKCPDRASPAFLFLLWVFLR